MDAVTSPSDAAWLPGPVPDEAVRLDMDGFRLVSGQDHLDFRNTDYFVSSARTGAGKVDVIDDDTLPYTATVPAGQTSGYTPASSDRDPRCVVRALLRPRATATPFGPAKRAAAAGNLPRVQARLPPGRLHPPET